MPVHHVLPLAGVEEFVEEEDELGDPSASEFDHSHVVVFGVVVLDTPSGVSSLVLIRVEIEPFNQVPDCPIL